MQLLTSAGIAVVVFVSTNLDDLFLLLMFFSNRNFRARHVILGQVTGIGLLTLASILCASASVLLPSRGLALLGILPLALGLGQLYRRIRPGEKRANEDLSARRSNFLFVFAVTLSHGADNLAVYIPLFATISPVARGVTFAIFMILTGVWCALSYGLVRHPLVAQLLQRIGPWSRPFVLIALGIWILSGAL